MTFGLDEQTITRFQSVFRKYPEVESVIIYGSRAKGNYREGSDIDLTLVGERVTDSIRSRIWLGLDALNTPYLIDLSIFKFLDSDSLVKHIQRCGRSFYKKAETE